SRVMGSYSRRDAPAEPRGEVHAAPTGRAVPGSSSGHPSASILTPAPPFVPASEIPDVGQGPGRKVPRPVQGPAARGRCRPSPGLPARGRSRSAGRAPPVVVTSPRPTDTADPVPNRPAQLARPRQDFLAHGDRQPSLPARLLDLGGQAGGWKVL